jgi:predicted PurR-regulated permease PerM
MASGIDPRSDVPPATGRETAQHEMATPPHTGADAVGRGLRPEHASDAFYASQAFSDSQFFRRTLLVASVVVVTGLLLALIWYASDIFLLLFGGVLLAVLLRAPTNWFARYSPISEKLALSLSIIGLAAFLFFLAYLFAVPMAEQLGQLIETLPRALAQMRRSMREYEWAAPLQPVIDELSRMKIDVQMIGRASWLISSTVAALGGLVVVVFIGIYLAAQPRLYQRGFMHLLPRRRRPRAYEVLDEVGNVLRAWLLGRLVTMAVVGLMAGLGLWWLQVPLAFTLGMLSGLLEFVPYVGPILAAALPLLIAFNLDPSLALYVLLLYAAIQTAENYLLTPLVEQRAVALPPALVIFATLLLAALAGPLGVVFASPLTATCIVAIKLLYVEDVVEQPPVKPI